MDDHAPEGAAAPTRPRTSPLIVVGAAAGMGRWLVEHVFVLGDWPQVVLVDTARSATALAAFDPDVEVPVVRALAPDQGDPLLRDLGTGAPVALAGDRPALCLAVPRAALADVCRWGQHAFGSDVDVVHVAASLGPSLEQLAAGWPGARVAGMHPLVDLSARSLDGQTVLVVPAEDGPAMGWLLEDVHAAGGIAEVIPAAAHERTMAYVQAMAHQALVSFIAAVADSGLPLDDVWEARTPLFEALFGLASRVLTEGREATNADIQLALDGAGVADELARASARTTAAVASGSHAEVEALLRSTRDRFSSALFEAVQETAASAVSAAQAKRAQLARRGRTGSLVGLRPVGRPDALRVGHVVDVQSTSVTLREVMVGRRGGATLLEGPGRRNAGRVGLSGKAKETTFGLAHIDTVLGDELDEELDDWLAHIRRDVRFLVPESVAGAGVLEVVGARPGVRDAEVVSEVVRTGQRSVVIRMGIRVDQDVDDVVEDLRARVFRAYAWPVGVSRPATGGVRLHFLGPAGTFSEEAASHAARAVGLEVEGVELVPEAGFPEVLAGTAAGDLAVLPLSSSASGLVSRAASALLAHDGVLEAGGVVDVAVRFDAYVQSDRSLEDLRGARVLSHPQGLAQCSAFIRRWGLRAESCPSTTDALEQVAASDGESVALAGADRGQALGLKVAEREVDDLSGSITRFVVLGPPDAFGELVGGSEPTLRSIFVSASVAPIVAAMAEPAAAFDELLTAPDGACLWITSRSVALDHPGLRSLGRLPWSPRTPVVRVEA